MYETLMAQIDVDLWIFENQYTPKLKGQDAKHSGFVDSYI